MAQLAFDILARDRASRVFDQVAGKASKTEQNLSKVGSTSGAVFGKMTAAVGGLALGWQAWDKVMVGGFNRLANLDDARKRLDQMGLSTSESAKLMDGLTKTVTGTAFSLDAGANAMTGFVSAGVDLDEVNDRLEMTADTAAFAQAPLDEIANIFVKIQSQGKLTAEELNMLQERGVPALVLLADAAGVTAEAMRDMISRGEVDAERFFDLWEQGSKGFGENNIKIAGAAKSMGDTLRGSLANAETALSRMGARLIDEFIPAIQETAEQVKGAADGVIQFLDATQQVRDVIGDVFAKINPDEQEGGWGEFLKGAKDAAVDAALAWTPLGPIIGLVSDNTDEAAKSTGFFAGESDRLRGVIENYLPTGDEMADGMAEVAEETAAATEAFSAYQDALKASTDPVFGLISAVNKVDEAQRAYNEAVDQYGSSSAEAQGAAVDLFEATVGLDSAAHNADLSFAGVNDVLADMVSQGALTAEQAEIVAGAVDEARESAEDYQGPYTADLLADIDDPAIRDAKRQLDAVARTRSPRYRAELDRQAEIRARNKLNAVANTRRARINASASTRSAEQAINYAARPRSTTISVNVRTYGALEFHQGGVIGGGLRRAHDGFKLRSDERVVIGQTGERILSRRQTAAFDELVSSMGQRSSLFAGRAGAGAAVVNNYFTLQNQGVIGSQSELDRWLSQSVNRLRRTGRLN